MRRAPPYTWTMFRSALAILLAATLSAGPTSIGLISASGPLSVDRSTVWGNATVFEGTSIATEAASGDVALSNGVRLQLAAQSAAVIGANRAVLQKGSTQVNRASGGLTPREGGAYEVEARGLRIDAADGSRMLVALRAPNGVDVVALSGATRVMDRKGVLLASIQPGRSVAFAVPQEPEAGATTVTRAGCLLYKDMHFILHDDATNEVIEVNGPDLQLNVGKSVQVTGVPATTKPAVSIATSVMTVNNVAPRSTGGCLVIAQALDAQTQVPAAAAGPATAPPTAPAAAHTGLSAGAKAAIIIGIAAGGGAGAFLALKSKSSTSP